MRTLGEPAGYHRWLAVSPDGRQIANMIRDRFEGWGVEVATVIIAMIAVRELFAWIYRRLGVQEPAETS